MAGNTVTVLIYFRRNPSLTKQQMYEYWKSTHGPLVAPWIEYSRITSYKQVQVSGTIGGKEYDGIAMFEAESMDVIRAWEHPYYKEVLEPDEYNFVDKKAEDKGLVAQSIGSTVAIVEEGKSVFGEEGGKERKQWEQFMKDNVKL